MSAKEKIIEFVRSLPDDATYPDIMDVLDGQFGRLDETGTELTEEQWETAWVAEINRRVEAVERGDVELIPHEQVMREMREKYG